MSIPTSARALVLQDYVESETDPASIHAHFAVKELPLPNPLPEDSLLLKTLYLSNDPAQRLWMQKLGGYSEERTDMAGLPLGTPFQTFALSRVVQVGSKAGPFKTDFTIRIRREMPGVSLSTYLGSLGISGATAYWALLGVLKVKETDTLVVSGAAGAVGNVAVQYAKKVLGVKRVVGIAGSDEKCVWLKNIGADEAINYKSPTFDEDLAKATPEKVDKFFDNVGGSVLDELIVRMKPHGIIAAVGAMSLMNKRDKPVTMKNYVRLISNRISLVGYSIIDYVDRLVEAESALASAAADGKLILDGTETVFNTQGRLEEIPYVWAGLFTGVNTGKLITKIAD